MEWPPLNVSGHREEEILVEAESLGSDLRQNWRESEGLNPCWTLSWRSRAFPEGNLSKKGHKASKRWEFGITSQDCSSFVLQGRREWGHERSGAEKR